VITIKDSGTLEQSINLDCFTQPLSRGEPPAPAFSSSPNSGKLCGRQGQEDVNRKFINSKHSGLHSDTRHNQPSSPSQSPSPSHSSDKSWIQKAHTFVDLHPWIIIAAIATVVALVILVIWVISQFLNDEGESKGGGNNPMFKET